MRLLAIVATIALCAVRLAAAQTPTPVQHWYGLDPYKPSDAHLLRTYGSVLATQTPLIELRKLDPYKPSEAALLRALGGAIPLWPISYPLAPAPASLPLFSERPQCRHVVTTAIHDRTPTGDLKLWRVAERTSGAAAHSLGHSVRCNRQRRSFSIGRERHHETRRTTEDA